jgi:PAS domain S-box-containing protein
MNEIPIIRKVLKALSLEDSELDFILIREKLADLADDLQIVRAENERDFVAALQHENFDIILADFNLPSFNAFGALEYHKKYCPDVPFICVTGAVGEETAIELIKQGAVDFVMKDKPERLIYAVDRALREAEEKLARRRTEAALLHSEYLMRYIIEHIRSAIAVFDKELKYIYVSQRYLKDFNIIGKDVIGKFHYDVFTDLPAHFKEAHRRALTGEVLSAEEDTYHPEGGSIIWAQWECRPWYESNGSIGGIIVATEVITERKRAEIQANLAAKILGLLNSNTVLDETIQQTLELIQNETKLEAVEIRLKKGKDFPYLCHSGDECICGFVISGKTAHSNPDYTPGGSFWTNDSRSTSSQTGTAGNRFRHRNRCIDEGYRSMAIIPVRAENEIIGLLQLNDKRKDRFSPGMILFFESVTQMIGVAFMRKRAQEELEKSHRLLYKLSEQVPGVIYQYRLFPDGRSCFPYASSGISNIYEVTPDEVKKDATPVFSRLHPDDIKHVSDLIVESARTLSHFYCEFRVNLPKQGVKWRFSDAVPERLEDNSILWHGIIYDITAIKETEKALTNKIDELQRFHNLTVDRELAMIELKKEVNSLLNKLGQKDKYNIVD